MKEGNIMWAKNSIFYQIYPIGFCGAPYENDGVMRNRIKKVKEWIPHMKQVGVDAIYFSPIFESDSHGYNTRDFQKIDNRLGSNEDFKEVCKALHRENIKVVLDGVFHHVGRGFFGFQDVLQHRYESRYKDWFYINFEGNSNYNDGLWYEGWEGHYDLVKLNLNNVEVINYLLESVTLWIQEFDIDGIRLDVAYSLDAYFLRRLREHCDWFKKDMFLIGEMIHGDYNRIANQEMLHSVTNYECYKGLYSSFNCMNMFEIMHSLQRQFGTNHNGLYGPHVTMFNFVDNHDVSRVATILNNKHHIPLIYTLLFGMPGIPCIYYGSEWGAQADKSQGDPALRAFFETPEFTQLGEHISKLAKIRKESKTLCEGSFKVLHLTNRQCVFERSLNGEVLVVAINADENDYYYHTGFDGEATDLLTGQRYQLGGGMKLEGYCSSVLKLD